MGSYGLQRPRCHEQMINNALKTADSLHYCDLGNHLVILGHFPSTNNNGPQEPQASREIHWHSLVNGTFTYTPGIVPQKKSLSHFLGGQICLVRSSSIPVDKDNRCSSQRTQPCLLGLGIWSLLCVCVMVIIFCASHRITHTCMWKERTSVDGWNQDVCKSSGGDKQRSKRTTTTGRDKHTTTTNAEISHCEL